MKKVIISLSIVIVTVILTSLFIFLLFLKPLSKEKNVLNAMLIATESQLNEANINNEELTEEIEEINADVIAKQNEIAEIQQEIEKSKSDLEKSKADLDKSKSDLQKSKSELEKSKADLAKANSQIAKANEIASQLKIYDNQSIELMKILDEIYLAIDNNNNAAYNSALVKYEDLAKKIEKTYDKILSLLKEFENI